MNDEDDRARRSGSALVHDFFFAPGGAEEVAVQLAGLLRGPDVYTTFIEPAYRGRLAGSGIHAWPLQRLFGPTRAYRAFLPLYPLWFSALDLRRYDLVVSSSASFAKAVRTRPGATHIAYVHAPMRYAWDLETYLAGSTFGVPTRVAARMLRPVLRRWDVRTSRRPDVLVANSTAVRERVLRYWGREAEVIQPPVDVDALHVSEQDDGYLLVAARMLAYRRLDVAVDAANRTGRSVVLVGTGPEEKRLRALAGPTVRFTGPVDRTTLIDLFQRCHAYIVPGEEDFGIAPVEAMAAGKPVVALRAGGALDTVADGITGVLFDRADPDALVDALDRLEGMTFDQHAIRAQAERFSTDVFRARWRELFARLGVDPSLYAG